MLTCPGKGLDPGSEQSEGKPKSTRSLGLNPAVRDSELSVATPFNHSAIRNALSGEGQEAVNDNTLDHSVVSVGPQW